MDKQTLNKTEVIKSFIWNNLLNIKQWLSLEFRNHRCLFFSLCFCVFFYVFHNEYELLFFFLFFSFFATSQHMEFPGQGSDPRHSWNLHHSCGNMESLTHCTGPGIKPASQCSRDAADPIVPWWELLNYF